MTKLERLVRHEIRKIELEQARLEDIFFRVPLDNQILKRFVRTRNKIIDLDVKRSKYVDVIRLLREINND